MTGGYRGKLLEVDLTTNSIHKRALDLNLVKSFIGGRGMIAKILWERLKPGTDPLSSGNLLMFLTGPLTGILDAHTCVGFKQPLTGTISHAMTGGHWGPELKFAGYDGVIISGKANSPVYIYVTNDTVEIRDAKHLWGKGTTETERKIKEEIDDSFVRVLCCGPAGENLVKTTGIIQSSWRAAARGGGGAVMGSKMLKAVAVRGRESIEIAMPNECFKLVDEYTERFLKTGPLGQRYRYKRYGSSTTSLVKADMGYLSVKNDKQGDWDQIDRVGGVKYERKYVVDHASCYNCPGGCFHVGVVRSGPYSGTVSQLDFDSSAVIGPSCLVTDLDGLMYINALCDELGVDAEGIGDIVAWTMECYEKGLLTKEELGGIDLVWGNVPAMIELIMKIVKREGIGDVLAEGLEYATRKVGKESEKFAMHCKGMGFGGWNPTMHERGLQYAVGDRGGCHHYGTSIDNQNFRVWSDSLTFCSWHRFYTLEEYSELVKAATGVDLIRGGADWDLIAERMLTLARSFNIREGIVPLRDDVLPERVHTEPLTYGMGKGHIYTKEEFEKDRVAWYNVRGCNEKGIPTKDHLKELSLDFVIPELERIGAYKF